MIGRDCRSVVRCYATSSHPDKAGVTKGNVSGRGRSHLFTQNVPLSTIKGSVPPIYIKGDTLYYSRSISLANESGSEGGRLRGRSHLFTQKVPLFTIFELPLWQMSRGVSGASSGCGGVPLLPRKVDVIRTMGEAILDGAGGERSLFWGHWRVSIGTLVPSTHDPHPPIPACLG